MIIEMDDEAVEVDLRAFYKAAVYIAKCTNGKISMDGYGWMEINDFVEMKKDHLIHSFDEAVDISL